MPKKKSMEDRIAALEAKVNGTLTTRILVIQDRSGSMYNRIAETIDGYNEYVGALGIDDSDEAYLTLVQFDDHYEVKEESTPVASVAKLDESTFVPRGWTALYDAVGKGITEFKKTLNEGDRAFVVIMTDGLENSSKEFNRGTISTLIKQCEDEGRWTFTFLGAGRDAWSGAQAMGLRRNQAAFYGVDGHSHEAAFKSMVSTTHRYRGGQGMAMAATGATVSNLMAKEGADVELEEDDTSATKAENTSEGVRSTKRRAGTTSGSES